MKTARIALLVSLCASAALSAPALHAQQSHPTPQQVEAVPAPKAARPALWKVSDADTTVYLFGTIHLLPQGIEWYDGKLAQAFEQSQELVTELPEIPQDQTMAVTMRFAALPKGQTLRGLMDGKEKAKFEAALQGFGIPAEALDPLKPWFTTVALASVPLVRAGYSLGNGVEAQLEKRNKALNRPRIGLETLEYQLGIFDALPVAAQKVYFFETIDDLSAIPQEIDKLVASWSKGDAAGLAELLNDEMDDPVLYKALLTDRNRNWSVWIDDRMDRPGTVFVAVGAGHLGGKDSVQEFLEKTGLKVDRVQ